EIKNVFRHSFRCTFTTNRSDNNAYFHEENLSYDQNFCKKQMFSMLSQYQKNGTTPISSLSDLCRTERSTQLNVKPELCDISVLHDIVFSFDACLTFCTCFGDRAEFIEV